MKIVDVTLHVRRYRNKRDFESYQQLEKDVRVFGVLVWRSVIDKEEVPTWASIQVATLGSTEWESKFSEYIK